MLNVLLYIHLPAEAMGYSDVQGSDIQLYIKKKGTEVLSYEKCAGCKIQAYQLCPIRSRVIMQENWDSWSNDTLSIWSIANEMRRCPHQPMLYQSILENGL